MDGRRGSVALSARGAQLGGEFREEGSLLRGVELLQHSEMGKCRMRSAEYT